MVKHCMTVIQKEVHKFHPGQIQIILPTSQFMLYLNKHNRNFQIILVKMGALHNEIAMPDVLGLILLGPNF